MLLVDYFIAKERTQESEIDCETLLETILNTESEVTELSYRIQDLMFDDNELGEYLKNSTVLYMKSKKSKRKLQKCLEYHSKSSVPIEIRRDARLNSGVKLPKIVLRKFSGDTLDWRSFKETFEAAVHSSDSISNIEKFTYLKKYLDKSALQAIDGFPLKNENYAATWQLLDERYGNEQLIISCHMNNLMKLDPIIQPSVKEMQKMHCTIEINVRALSSLGINYEHCGPLLVPIILEKLPNTIKLQSSRKLEKENWNIEQFLSAINQEITARENFEYLKQNSFDSKEESKIFTTSSLHAQARLKKCVFCKCEDYHSNQCRIITDIDTRREILKKGNICFTCLKPGHIKKSCRNKIKCFRCKAE